MTTPAWKVIHDNYVVRVRGDHLNRRSFDDAIARIAEPDFWAQGDLWSRVAMSLPSYRLSKFQALMPPWIEREVVGSYLLDPSGASRWLSGRSV